MMDPDSGTTTDKESWAGVSIRESANHRNPVASRGQGTQSEFLPDTTLAVDDWMETLCAHCVIPHTRQGDKLVLAASRYIDALRAASALGIAHRIADVIIIGRAQITEHLLQRYGDALTTRATQGLRETTPHLSASTGFPLWMKALWGGLALLAIAALIAAPHAAALNLWLVFLPYCAATMILRAILIAGSLRSASSHEPAPARTPIVSIFVPVFNEAHSLPDLIASLKALDWPVRALDIKILLEADDTATIAEARWLTAGSHIDCFIVPPSEPRTKPKAMNVALPFARGEIIAIFDAEDCPQPDQIRKAVATLDAGGESVACAQARLSHYNADDNLMTRCVAMEYALWFDVLLTGLSRLHLPVPLGGTSLYIRANILREVGGWDADNVTEDADLGLRLARVGKRAVVFDSFTHEEATGSARIWIGQRSRWIKGFMLTWAVHMRSPRRLIRDLGFWPAIAINVLLLDGFLSFLIQPVMILSASAAILLDTPPWLGMLSAPGAGFLLGSLFAGQLLLLTAAIIASHQRFGRKVSLFAPLLWPYWMLGGIAALRAAWQVAACPQLWEKTAHCISPVAKARRAKALALRKPH